jgi:membrane associated rhomboid family serine protease
VVPLRDNNPTRLTPVITFGIIALNIVIFLYELSLNTHPANLGAPALAQFFNEWALVPAEFTASLQGQLPYSPLYEWITLITSQFLHGGWLHIGGNMLYLLIFGNNIEDKLGHTRYLIFYLACGALAALTQWAFEPNSEIPTLGASGAIAGIMGAYIIRFPRAEVLTLVPLGFFWWTVNIPAVAFLGIWFVMQVFTGLASLSAPTMVGMEGGGVAYWAHAGGFVFGVLLGPLLGLFATKPSGN